MKNSNPLSTNYSAKISNWFILGLLVFSFIGFLDASYLAAKHFLGEPVTCIIFTGCEAVLNSSYSVIFGIPVSLFGAIYYAIFFFLSILYFDIQKVWIVRVAAILALTGFSASLYLVYLQIFIIRAICFYCMISAANSTMIFALTVSALRGLEVKSTEKNESQISENNS